MNGFYFVTNEIAPIWTTVVSSSLKQRGNTVQPYTVSQSLINHYNNLAFIIISINQGNYTMSVVAKHPFSIRFNKIYLYQPLEEFQYKNLILIRSFARDCKWYFFYKGT